MPDDVCSADGQSEDDKSQDNSSSPQPALLLFLEDLPPAAQNEAAKDVLEQLPTGAESALETGAKAAGGGLLRVLGLAASLLTFSSDDECRGSDGRLWFASINPTTGKPYSSPSECRETLSRISAAEYQRAQLQKATEASGYYSDGSVDDCTQTCKAPAPAPPTFTPADESTEVETSTIVLTCDPNWDDCQKRQAREKVRRLNEIAKRRGGLTRRPTAGRIRAAGNAWAAKFRSDSMRLCKGEAPSKLVFTANRDWLWKGDPNKAGPSPGTPTGTKDDFMDDCLYQQWVDSNCAPLDNASPDHVQDLQWGGHVQGPFAWLDRDVNEKLGRDMNSGPNADVDVATGFELICP